MSIFLSWEEVESPRRHQGASHSVYISCSQVRVLLLHVVLTRSLVPTAFFAHALAFMWTWLSIFMIPMAKVNREAILILSKPLNLEGTVTYHSIHLICKVADEYPGAGAELELCVYEAANVYYYKYSVGGMNVILVSIYPPPKKKKKIIMFVLRLTL